MNTKITLYTADCTGNVRNTIYPRKVEVKDLDDFRKAMKYDHVCAEYKGFHRSVADFISADCIMLDCDNIHSDEPSEWVAPEDIRAAFPDVGFYICYSRHHNKEKDSKSPRPKFHIYFAIDPVMDAKEYADMKDLVVARFSSLYFDTNARDAARFFFGVNAPQVALMGGEEG
jgi:putative DNA primase/helicase